MALVKDEPADRRAFLDVELCQIYAGYLNVLAVYRKAQEQRNALLKAIGTRSVGPSEFEPWEDQMAESGHAVRAYRRSFVERLAPCCAEAHAFMGAGESLGVAYAPRDACDTPAALRELYAERRSEEIERGTTLVGPHRDDLSVSIDQRDARAYGSQGQQRTAVVALKLAALQVYASLGIVPVLLLDDILSDLDEGRRERLVEWVVGYGGQVFLTCTEPSAAGRSALSRAKVVEIRAGEIIER
jgi:DNA replication and repair protein RecF